MASQPVSNTVAPDPAPSAVPDPLIHVPRPFIERLKPAMDETVGLVSPGYWSIGSLMICKKLTDGEELPADVVCSWSDEGATYCLQKRTPPRVDRNPEGDCIVGRYPTFCNVFQNSVWNLSPNVFCKTRSWIEGLTTEATTIRWVTEHVPSVPVEKLIYDWVDAEWNRSVMISWRVPGKTYEEAWKGFTKQQRLAVADQIADHQKTLSEFTSDYVETVEGTALAGAYSLRVRETRPSWKPRLEPRTSREDYEAYLQRIRNYLGEKMEIPHRGEPLVLHNPECTPDHILVTTPENPSEMPKVTGIIAWHTTGYFFKLQIPWIPRSNAGFMVEQSLEGADWLSMLSNALVRAGFPFELEYMISHKRADIAKSKSPRALEESVFLHDFPPEFEEAKQKCLL